MLQGRFRCFRARWGEARFGPLYAWSSAIQGKTGPMKLPVMLRVLMSWLADRLHKPSGPANNIPSLLHGC